MNQHLGASCTLSVLILIVFAIAFYRPESRQALPRTGPIHSNPLTGPMSARTPGNSPPLSEAIASRRVEPGRMEGGSHHARPTSADKAEPAAATIARRVSHQEPPKRAIPAPKRAFATVGPGETLADVAARVYGPAGSAEALRKANRDLLPSAETPVEEGMVLRTP